MPLSTRKLRNPCIRKKPRPMPGLRFYRYVNLSVRSHGPLAPAIVHADLDGVDPQGRADRIYAQCTSWRGRRVEAVVQVFELRAPIRREAVFDTSTGSPAPAIAAVEACRSPSGHASRSRQRAVAGVGITQAARCIEQHGPRRPANPPAE